MTINKFSGFLEEKMNDGKPSYEGSFIIDDVRFRGKSDYVESKKGAMYHSFKGSNEAGQELSVSLFENKNATSEKSPVMTGYLKFSGNEYKIAGWLAKEGAMLTFKLDAGKKPD